MRSAILSTALTLLPFVALAAAAPSSIVITDAVSPATLSGSMMGAGFMTITNNGTTDCTLGHASSSVSRVVELHDHLEENGVMKMRQVKEVVIAKGQQVTFQSGGLHLMLIDLNAPLVAGQTFRVSLDFGACGTIEQPFHITPQS